MQTFLTNQDFQIAASQLDSRRLGKQRVECLQILKALTNPDYGWQNHPAVNMWRGHEQSLVDYSMDICDEWIARGYKDTCAKKIYQIYRDSQSNYPNAEKIYPLWLTEEFCSNHRSILLGKVWEKLLSFNDFPETKKIYSQHKKAYENVKWYRQFNWIEKPAERIDGRWPYLWPARD